MPNVELELTTLTSGTRLYPLPQPGTPHKINPFLCTLHWFVVYSQSCATSSLFNSHHPKKKPCIHELIIQQLTCFLFLQTCLFWTFYINEIIQHVAFCVKFLSLHIFKVHQHCGTYLDCFCFLAIVNYTVWILLFKFLCEDMFSILRDVHIKVESMSYLVTLTFC